mmetsp:Transcript_126481/g.369561  ORF Transcript_126481/g.369561 Transcript_126481/m.369561 type:complete len:212 (+) Transcript_126481:1444-2079(+)
MRRMASSQTRLMLPRARPRVLLMLLLRLSMASSSIPPKTSWKLPTTMSAMIVRCLLQRLMAIWGWKSIRARQPGQETSTQAKSMMNLTRSRSRWPLMCNLMLQMLASLFKKRAAMQVVQMEAVLRRIHQWLVEPLRSMLLPKMNNSVPNYRREAKARQSWSRRASPSQRMALQMQRALPRTTGTRRPQLRPRRQTAMGRRRPASRRGIGAA